MYVSLSQIITSLERLNDVHPFFGYAFLGFKKFDLPIGKTTSFHYKYIKDEVLDPYFRIANQTQIFNPFKSAKRWVAEGYETGSLQRITADTFSSAFIHEKKSSDWGWKNDYVRQLKRVMQNTGTLRIPMLDLAVWLYRKQNLDDSNPQNELIRNFISEFKIDDEELLALFDSLNSNRTIELASEPVSDVEILNQLGWPDGSIFERSGVIISYLSLLNVGPTEQLAYRPAPRINIITGDNSLGKTFLLDCAWWCLTGIWMSYAADPSSERRISRAEINYTLSSESGREESFTAPFNLLNREWQRPEPPMQGLALYANFSGGFALWDPLQQSLSHSDTANIEQYLSFRKEEVWEGLVSQNSRGKQRYISNGLIRDWTTWQRGSLEHELISIAFEGALKELSPPEGFQLRPGRPVILADDSREIPTIRMPYGDIPILYASAGIQRVLSLAYMLVWSWFRHLQNSKIAEREPIRTIVLVIDEIESHLHPKWQRQIIPALMKAVEALEPQVKVQLHISSHSPLVLASLEPLFVLSRDRIHNLTLNENEVSLDVIENWKHGSINYWLESDVFGLKEARSKPAESTLDQARKLQIQTNPDPHLVERTHRDLVKLLPDDDPFWVRWGYFYNKHGRAKL
jgi:hypothetical protein